MKIRDKDYVIADRCGVLRVEFIMHVRDHLIYFEDSSATREELELLCTYLNNIAPAFRTPMMGLAFLEGFRQGQLAAINLVNLARQFEIKTEDKKT